MIHIRHFSQQVLVRISSIWCKSRDFSDHNLMHSTYLNQSNSSNHIINHNTYHKDQEQHSYDEYGGREPTTNRLSKIVVTRLSDATLAYSTF